MDLRRLSVDSTDTRQAAAPRAARATAPHVSHRASLGRRLSRTTTGELEASVRPARANARSAAVWNRAEGLFSRHRFTIRKSPGGSADAAGPRSRLLVENCRHRLRGRFPAKRADARQQLVKDDAERKEICAMVDRQATDLLGRHVADRAEHDAGLCRRVRRPRSVPRQILRQLCQPEVENLHATVAS